MLLFSEPADSTLPASAAADKTLPSIRFVFASGNDCIATPYMRRHGVKCAVSISQQWRSKPDPADEAEMVNILTGMLSAPPDLRSGFVDEKDAVNYREAFLKTGKPE